MGIKVDWSSYPDRERRSEFTNRLIPESCFKSAGASIKDVRRVAKEINSSDIELEYIEDIILKGIVIYSKKESFESKVKAIPELFPLLTSWLTTDTISASLYIKECEKDTAFDYFYSLLDSEKYMVVRLSIVTLLSKFFEEKYISLVLDKIVKIESNEHLLNMAIAWYLSIAYIKYPSIYDHRLNELNHTVRRMTIQKIRDSKRVPKEIKNCLK